MALPVGLPTVTVTAGPYNDYLGVPYSGTIEVTPSTPVIWAATGAVLLNGAITFTADAAGAFSFVLPATDASGLTVQDFTYTVRFSLRSAAGEVKQILPIIIQLPEAVPSVDLDLLETIVSSTGISVGLPSVILVVGRSGVVTGAHILADSTVAAALALKASTTHAATHASAGSDPLTLAQSQITGLSAALALLAPLASPALTGVPTVPTAAPGTNTTQAASTAFTAAAVAVEAAARTAADALLAPLASPALTGNPTAPTPSPGDSDTSIATSAFVAAAIAAAGVDGGTA